MLDISQLILGKVNIFLSLYRYINVRLIVALCIFSWQAYHSMAKCVAALTLTHPSEAVGVVNRFLMDVTNPRSPTVQSFSLLAIGEIGKHM